MGSKIGHRLDYSREIILVNNRQSSRENVTPSEWHILSGSLIGSTPRKRLISNPLVIIY